MEGLINIKKYIYTRTAGAYGPLVLAPAEGMGVLRAPCRVWVICLIFVVVLLTFLTFLTVFFFIFFTFF